MKVQDNPLHRNDNNYFDFSKQFNKKNWLSMILIDVVRWKIYF